MSSVRLTRVDTVAAKHDPWTAALMDDYEMPEAAHVFVGRGLEDNERVAFFIGKDGGGIGFIDRDPAGYVEASKHMEAATEYKAIHGVWPPNPSKLAAGPEEYEFDEGTFNYNAKSIVQEASMSFF
jgi:hypothetical protein